MLCVILRIPYITTDRDNFGKFEKLTKIQLFLKRINMNKTEMLKKEMKESYLIFFFKFLNFKNLLPLVISILCICITFYLIYTTPALKSENIGVGIRYIMLIFSLLSSLSIKWFFDVFSKIKDEEKIRDRAILSVRHLDSLYLTIVKDKNYNTIEMKNIELGVLTAIESWNDVLPELRYRDRTKITQELERQIKELEEKTNTLTKEEYEEKIKAIKTDIQETEYLGLNYSGGIRSCKLLNFDEFVKQSNNKK